MKQFVLVVLVGALTTFAASTLAQTATKPPHKPATAAKPAATAPAAKSTAPSPSRLDVAEPSRRPSPRRPSVAGFRRAPVRHPVFVPPPPVIELDEIAACPTCRRC